MLNEEQNYEVGDVAHATLFGLPSQVKFCKKCVISNQRPNSATEYSHVTSSIKSTIAFDEEGVCDACRFAEQKKSTIDWVEREAELYDLARRYEGLPGKYNCLVPGSGGKDSFYQAHVLKNKFGFRPLTVTWAPHLYTDWGWRNFQAWIQAGFDNILVTPNGQVYRLLTRLAVDNLFHPFQPFILGQKGMAPRLAAQFKIPLIFYGENEAEYGNPIADTEGATRDDKYFTVQSDVEIFISGVPISDLLGRYKLPRYELQQYLPIDYGQLTTAEIEVHYLGYYLRWYPQSAYYYAVEHGASSPAPNELPVLTASTTPLMTRLMISITGRPTSSSASGVRPTTRLRKYETRTLLGKRESLLSSGSTASGQTVLKMN